MRPASTPPLEPQVNLPADEGLPGLPLLFENKWVWNSFCANFGEPEETPRRIRPWQIRYQPGSNALVSYIAEWERDEWVQEHQFTIELAADKPERFFHYPDDPALPGLRLAASAPEAQELLMRHVPISLQPVRIEALRYRPASRAVLRYSARWRRASSGRISLFVRVMPPSQVPRLLRAWDLAEHAGFCLPQLVGCWADGGIVWVSKVHGSTLRRMIRKGRPPDPGVLLNGLAKLWAAPAKPNEGQPLKLQQGFRATHRLLTHILQDERAQQALKQVTNALGPFSETWRPLALAHNDFYDDQIILTSDGRLALVDFEEVGPGDPMLDVGNMLAHLSWMAHFGAAPEACEAYRRWLRSISLDRFGWSEHDLDLREAFALFRLSTNPFRTLHPSWSGAVERGLRLAIWVLEGAA